MKKTRKVICVLCALIMALTSLTGCGSKPNTEEKTTAAQSSETKTTEAAESNADSETGAAVGEPVQKLPISEEGITLTVAMPVNAKVEDINTNQLTLYIEEQTGINLEFIELSTDDTATQINTLMNGGDLPDIILSYNFPYDTLCSYADAGLLQPLDDYIDTWGYNLKNNIMEDPDLGKNVLSHATYDGHVWAMPSGGGLVTNVYARYQPYIQTAFLEELGMDLPKTLDELRTFLEAVQEKYPDVTPMTSYAKDNYIFANISQAYQYTDISTYLKVSDDGKVEFIANNDLFKEAIEYAKGMVDDGLIDPAAFTQDSSVLATLFAQEGNNVAVIACGYFITSVMDSGGDEYHTMRLVGTLEGPDGYVSTQLDSVSVRRSMVITSACEYPEEAFRLFDFFLSDDFALTARVGFEGAQWAKAEEGVLGRDGEQAWFTLLTNQEWVAPSTNVIWDTEGFIHSNIMNHCEASASNLKYPNEVVEQGLKGLRTDEMLPQLVMGAEDTAEYNELQKLIVDSVNSNIARFILGTRDLSEWDAFCKELTAMGADVIHLEVEQ